MGTSVSFTTYSDGTFSFGNIYYDDGPSPGNDTASDVATIVLNVTANGTQLFTQTTATVQNVNPSVIDPGTGLETIELFPTEPGGPAFVVSGLFRDPGVSDVHTVTVNWGDGTPPEIFTHPQLSTFSKTHSYPPSGITYTVTVAVADDDLGSVVWSKPARIYLLDLDNDANNNGEIEEIDDPIEHIFPGAYLGVNGDDDNENTVADLDDNGPVNGENDLEEFRVRWTPANRPEVNSYQGWMVGLFLTPAYTAQSGTLQPNGAAIYEAANKTLPLAFVSEWNGQNIPGGPAAIWPAGSALDKTLYLEARSAGQMSMTLRLFAPNYFTPASDTVVFTALQNSVNITIHDGQSGPAVPDDVEVSLGAFTVANLNDTDGDGNEDRNDNAVLAYTQTVGGVQKVRGIDEVDLMQLVVDRPANYVPGTGVYLHVLGIGEEDVRFWKKPTKEEAISIDENSFTAGIGFAAGEMSRTLWVELRWYSLQIRCIEIEARYGGASDKVAVTGVWAIKEAHDSAGTAAAALFASEPWSNLPASSPIRRYVTALGSTGKIDLYREPSVRNVIIQAWKPLPEGILNEPGLAFDITRRKHTLAAVYLGDVYVDGITEPYPDKLDEANDELVGDETDEDGPYGGLLFVLDGPGLDGLPAMTVPTGRRFYGDNFEEFVRVRLDGTRPSGNTLDGSRASDKFKWYSHSYILIDGGVWKRAATFNHIGPGQNFNKP
jgi:hypothetical protein